MQNASDAHTDLDTGMGTNTGEDTDTDKQRHSQNKNRHKYKPGHTHEGYGDTCCGVAARLGGGMRPISCFTSLVFEC